MSRLRLIGETGASAPPRGHCSHAVVAGGYHRPARAVVPVGPLHYGFGVEVDAVAFVGP